MKPGGVVTPAWVVPGVFTTVLGENWCVLIEELGAFMTELAVNGEGEAALTENARIVRRGRELLDSQRDSKE